MTNEQLEAIKNIAALIPELFFVESGYYNADDVIERVHVAENRLVELSQGSIFAHPLSDTVVGSMRHASEQDKIDFCKKLADGIFEYIKTAQMFDKIFILKRK